jgi:hypothetical protein
VSWSLENTSLSYAGLIYSTSAIGSFLFGYDSGIISSVISSSYTEFQAYMNYPSDNVTGAIVSVFAGGAFCESGRPRHHLSADRLRPSWCPSCRSNCRLDREEENHSAGALAKYQLTSYLRMHAPDCGGRCGHAYRRPVRCRFFHRRSEYDRPNVPGEHVEVIIASSKVDALIPRLRSPHPTPVVCSPA